MDIVIYYLNINFYKLVPYNGDANDIPGVITALLTPPIGPALVLIIGPYADGLMKLTFPFLPTDAVGPTKYGFLGINGPPINPGTGEAGVPITAPNAALVPIDIAGIAPTTGGAPTGTPVAPFNPTGVADPHGENPTGNEIFPNIPFAK